MSAPIIWIIFPLSVSAALLAVLDKPKLVRRAGFVVSLLLAMFALFQPIGNVLKLGPISIDIIPELAFFGRSFLLENSDRFTLSLIYITLTVFIGGVKISHQPVKFTPLALAIASMLTAALSVQPFLYSAVMVELAVLLMVPLVTVKGSLPERGVIRLLIYLSMAMLFILFAGWILSGSQASLSDEAWRSLAALFLGIGFALWLAVFPFHSWVSQFSRDVQPYISSFIFSLLPVITLLIMLDYVSSLVWLRETGNLSLILRIVGTIMIVTSGIWAAVENDLKRVLAFGVLYETGFALLLVSVQSNESISMLYQSFAPRIIGLSLFGLSLSILQKSVFSLTISGLVSALKKHPLALISLLISLFEIVGFPLFAGFPIKFETLKLVGSTDRAEITWVMFGITGFLITVIRIFSSITLPSVEKWEIREDSTQIVFLCIGCLVLLLLGWFPGIFETFVGSLLINLPVLQ